MKMKVVSVLTDGMESIARITPGAPITQATSIFLQLSVVIPEEVKEELVKRCFSPFVSQRVITAMNSYESPTSTDDIVAFGFENYGIATAEISVPFTGEEGSLLNDLFEQVLTETPPILDMHLAPNTLRGAW